MLLDEDSDSGSDDNSAEHSGRMDNDTAVEETQPGPPITRATRSTMINAEARAHLDGACLSSSEATNLNTFYNPVIPETNVIEIENGNTMAECLMSTTSDPGDPRSIKEALAGPKSNDGLRACMMNAKTF